MPSEKHRQGSGLSRREALRFLGAASALPLFHPALTHHPPVEPVEPVELAAGSAWRPLFLDPKDVEIVASLSDCIVPRTRAPGARDAAVHEYIDFALSRAEPSVQASFSEGLRWLDDYVRRSMRQRLTFTELDRDQQHQLLAEISDTSRSHEPKGYAFFTQIKQLTIEGYYRS